ncbi:MAG: hypothetical protein HUU54_07965 [Ignavibacteriaceae bacterium]|nr:hypothetical protein [Ignavibacteriaceae bacterium]
MKITYKFYPERSLLVDVVEGKTVFDDLRDIFLYFSNPELFPPYHLVLSDITKCELDVKLEDITAFGNLIAGKGITPEFRWAIFSSGAKTTAMSIMLENIPGMNDQARVFTSLGGCANFLGVNFSDEELKDPDYKVFREV